MVHSTGQPSSFTLLHCLLSATPSRAAVCKESVWCSPDIISRYIFQPFIDHLLTISVVPMINDKKGKALSLQAWSGPEGSRKLRFPDFMTTAQDGGKFVKLTYRPPLTPGNAPGTYMC